MKKSLLFKLSFLLLSLFLSLSPQKSLAASSSVTPEDLSVLEPARKANALLISDSACGSCSKLVKALPKTCNLKPKSFAVLATGNVKKNEKKLAHLKDDFDLFYSKSRGVLTTIKAPATPSLLINQKHYVVGYNAIIKYFSENSKSFCLDKS